jgi:hypothetical protein
LIQSVQHFLLHQSIQSVQHFQSHLLHQWNLLVPDFQSCRLNPSDPDYLLNQWRPCYQSVQHFLLHQSILSVQHFLLLLSHQ